MTDRESLYRAILAHPDDDTSRLVYADWLQENGREEEAEFIRVECRLEAAAPDDPEYTDLLDRQDELRLWLTAHAPGPIPRFPAGLHVARGTQWWEYTQRGFSRYLEFDGYNYRGPKAMRALAAALPKVFAKLPTRWLVVRYITVGQLAELLKRPEIAALDELTVHLSATDDPQDEACELIALCPNLRNLRRLILMFPVGDAGVASLAHSKHLGRLARLGFDHCLWWTAAAVRSLGSADWFRGLRSLDLSELDDAPFEELCRLEPFPNLHTLELQEASFSLATWQAFARSKTFPRLTRLVNHTDMSGGRAAALARANGFTLTALALGGAAIGNDGAQALVSASWFRSLRWLSLRVNRLGSTGVAAIAGSRKLSNLRYLDLFLNALSGSGLQAIAANPALRGLSTLLLAGDAEYNRGLKPEHFHAFLSKLNMPNLRYLDLSLRPVGNKAARLLTDEKFGSLRRLWLRGCKLTDAVVSALLAAPALQNLIQLNLGGNNLKDGVKALADPGTMPNLSSSWVADNRVSPALKRKLNRRPGMIV